MSLQAASSGALPPASEPSPRRRSPRRRPSNVSTSSTVSSPDSELFQEGQASQELFQALHQCGALRQVHVVHAGRRGGQAPTVLDMQGSTRRRIQSEPWDLRVNTPREMGLAIKQATADFEKGTRAGAIIIEDSSLEVVRALALAMRQAKLPTVMLLCRDPSAPRCAKTQNQLLKVAAEAEANFMVQLSCKQDTIAEFALRIEQSIIQRKIDCRKEAVIGNLRAENLHMMWLSIDRSVEGLPVLDANLPSQVGIGTELQGLRIEALLGSGSTGQVFSTHATDEQPALAIKAVHKAKLRNTEMVAWILKECAVMQGLEHPHIVQFYDLLHGPSHLFLVQEYASRYNLSMVLQQQDRQRFDLDTARTIWGQLADAVDYCHSHGVVHCDIKPENVAFRSDRKSGIFIKLLDFGMARAADEECEDGGGSMPFVAPEVFTARSWWPGPTDIWSLGMVLLEICAGFNFLRDLLGREVAWKPDGESVKAIADAVTNHGAFGIKYARLITSDIPTSFWDLVAGMMQLEPDRRLTARKVVRSEWTIIGKRPSDKVTGM